MRDSSPPRGSRSMFCTMSPYMPWNSRFSIATMASFAVGNIASTSSTLTPARRAMAGRVTAA
jgi:hypothetical protein